MHYELQFLLFAFKTLVNISESLGVFSLEIGFKSFIDREGSLS